MAAAIAAGEATKASLSLDVPKISQESAHAEWVRALAAISAPIARRMQLSITRASDRLSRKHTVKVKPPQFRYEVLRLLIGTALEKRGAQTQNAIIRQVGGSQTPVLNAFRAFRAAGIVMAGEHHLHVPAADISWELLSTLNAVPQTLRFRFTQGAQIKSPEELLKRALKLLSTDGVRGWEHFALSGIPVAVADVPELNINGAPRLDLIAQLSQDCLAFDLAPLRMLDASLEPEPNILAPAPVVITVAKAATIFVRNNLPLPNKPRSAHPMDVFISLLHAGQNKQAIRYAKSFQK